jgi:3-hydroxybutyryl-CoA dehydrogenase
MAIEEVLVLGAGAIGREVALQCAMFGYRTTLCDTDRDVLAQARVVLELLAPTLAGSYVADTAEQIRSRLYFTGDLEGAAGAADLVIENVPEDPELKGRVLGEVNALAPPHAIFATNTSSLAPSAFAAASGRPERLLALHFHKTVWISAIADVMPHPGTDPALVTVMADFARSIGQIPVVLKKEIRGYVFNSMLQAYMRQAMALWADGVASFEDIDRAWMVAERARHGPLGAMDFIGLDTVHDIFANWARIDADPLLRAGARRLKTEFLDRARLGLKCGRGFYDYPDPAFTDPAFVAPPVSRCAPAA